ncbi:aureocin A53 family class IId bacteriocin [Virgibacillus pantothenticus]|nr:aureocin A53 family class IId bacteriocin [Virgibacillus pantothenticus]
MFQLGRLLSSLSGPALKWAKKNLSKIGKWFKDGASFSWVYDQITGMFK